MSAAVAGKFRKIGTAEFEPRQRQVGEFLKPCLIEYLPCEVI